MDPMNALLRAIAQTLQLSLEGAMFFIHSRIDTIIKPPANSANNCNSGKEKKPHPVLFVNLSRHTRLLQAFNDFVLDDHAIVFEFGLGLSDPDDPIDHSSSTRLIRELRGLCVKDGGAIPKVRRSKMPPGRK